MTIRLGVLSVAVNTNRILAEIERQAGDRLDVVLHLGAKTDHFKASSLSRVKASLGTKGHLMDGATYSGSARKLIQSPDFFLFRDLHIDHMQRVSDSFAYNSHPLDTIHDFIDYYHVVADTMAAKIEETGVTDLLFFNVPHLAYDTMMYQVGKSMGLPITIVSQSLFPDKFFSANNPDDFGIFDRSFDAQPYKIEKGSKPDLFYMKGIKQEREEGGHITAQAYVQLMTFLLTKRPSQALNPVYLWKTLSHMRRVYGALPKWRDPFARFFHEDALAYFDHLASFEDQDVDLSGDFVYVPLQLQPEMTTSALGGRFRDQAYAIERLSEILPEGVRILVKENPKQGAFMRGPLFFERLKRIPSVTFLPSWADTHALTANAKFVATITGTVGWEAIRAGKPAVVFGNAWYRSLPGVYQFSDELTYDEIVNNSIDHDELERSVGALMGQLHPGVIDRHYTKIVDGYDEKKNDATAAKEILGLLEGRRHPTFGSKNNTL